MKVALISNEKRHFVGKYQECRKWLSRMREEGVAGEQNIVSVAVAKERFPGMNFTPGEHAGYRDLSEEWRKGASEDRKKWERGHGGAAPDGRIRTSRVVNPDKKTHLTVRVRGRFIQMLDGARFEDGKRGGQVSQADAIEKAIILYADRVTKG
jgi:hypothetical protein